MKLAIFFYTLFAAATFSSTVSNLATRCRTLMEQSREQIGSTMQAASNSLCSIKDRSKRIGQSLSERFKALIGKLRSKAEATKEKIEEDEELMLREFLRQFMEKNMKDMGGAESSGKDGMDMDEDASDGEDAKTKELPKEIL